MKLKQPVWFYAVGFLFTGVGLAIVVALIWYFYHYGRL